jgi:hypothetical protein
VVVLSTVAGCAPPRAETPAIVASNDPVAVFVGQLPDTPLEPFVSGASLVERLAAETDTARIPSEFSFVGLEPFGTDLMSAQKYATSSFPEALLEPATDLGPIVLVRVVRSSESLRANAPPVPDDLTAVPRDDVFPGAVLYLVDGTTDVSLTVPIAPDADLIIAGSRVDQTVVVAFAYALASQ